MTIAPHVVWPIAALLGEGPPWFPDEAALRFVDIKSGRLHCQGPERHTLDIGGMPSFVAFAAPVAGRALPLVLLSQG